LGVAWRGKGLVRTSLLPVAAAVVATPPELYPPAGLKWQVAVKTDEDAADMSRWR
jgi:hypothetical protein